MNKKIIITSIVGMLLLTSCGVSKDTNNDDKFIPQQKIEEIFIELNEKNKKIEFIDGIYGVYGEDEGAMSRSVIDVFEGKDDNHIDIGVYYYRTAAFYIEDIKITSNKNGEITATKQIKPNEIVWNYFVDDQNNEDPKLDVIIKDNKVMLRFNRDLKELNSTLEGDKIDLKCITEEGKETALNNILRSNFKDINKDVFEVIYDTENYLVVKVKSYIYSEDEFEKSYLKEGSESVGMDKYYNIDKKDKEILELDDITKEMDDLNKYIKAEIKKKKEEWVNSNLGVWPYNDFTEIEEFDYFENYFAIDEKNKIVKIRCLGYPNEAGRALGDMIIDVPFSFFDLN